MSQGPPTPPCPGTTGESDRTGESEFLRQLQAGDGAAFETLVRTHGGRMFAVAQRLLRNDADAQDALQDAFLSAFRSIDRFKGDSRLSTWLHRIVVNTALMRIRSRKRRPETSIEELMPRFLENGHFSDEPIEWRRSNRDLLESQETREQVRAMIDRLPDDYRTVLLMRDIEGFDTKETAELLGVTPNAAKIRLHRARIALRTLLDPIMRGAEAQ
ncbi:MAG: sigma-70 family RNA polymerase sigma factor [bacterium]|nr:sigma-70 family RNA polymerase sigma factor [bacterium]